MCNSEPCVHFQFDSKGHRSMSSYRFMRSIQLFVVVLVLMQCKKIAPSDDTSCHCKRVMNGRDNLLANDAMQWRSLEEVHSENSPNNDVNLTSFDWCEKGFCVPSWNQHIPAYCGACYAHGVCLCVGNEIDVEIRLCRVHKIV